MNDARVVMTAHDNRVVDIRAHAHRRALESRQATVRAALSEAAAWINAGLAGSVPLEEATCSADCALRAAVREVLRASVSA